VTEPLQARGLTVAYDGAPVVEGLDLVVPRERITAIVGANGCGKSTLLRALARLIAPRAGAVLLDGRAISELPARDLARRLGRLPSRTSSRGAGIRTRASSGSGPSSTRRRSRRRSPRPPRSSCAVARSTSSPEVSASAHGSR
jgi:iron complex transport system ATP-binding protein